MSTIELSASTTITIRTSATAAEGWNRYVDRWGYDGFHLRSQWGSVFSTALKHKPYFLTAMRGDEIVGVLPLMFVSGPIFGKFLASQPYLNTGGVLADSVQVAEMLIGQATELADDLDVKHLELRHERQIDHPRLNNTVTEKVHMRVALPATEEEFWDSLKSKVRSQIKKPRNDEALTAEFGRHNRLDEFYELFCRNMRDLGTPPFPKSLFRAMLDQFGADAEICTVRFEGIPVASGFLLHGPGTTLIPSASALREYNSTSCNMLMYWHVIARAIERGQTCFDFGRSSVNAGTHKFKKQWGAEERPAIWQYYSRKGDVGDARPNSGKYDKMIATWQKLPVWLTKLIGPAIVRGIP